MNQPQELLKIPHSSAVKARFSLSEDYICYLTLYRAVSCPSGISAMNVPFERIHSWICRSSGSDCKRDWRVASSMICRATPCIVAVTVLDGSCISCSSSDFSICLSIREPSVPVRLGYTCGKRGTKLARTEALASPTRKQVKPTLTRRRSLFVLRV